MIDRIFSLLLFRCRIYVESLSFIRMRLSSERKHISITDLTANARNNDSFVLGMTISDHDIFLMDESSICWVVLSDIANAFYD